MTNSLWLKSGAIVKSSSGIILCSHCPCECNCSYCMGGIAHCSYKLTLGTGFSNGVCGSCTDLNGLEIDVVQIAASACDWLATYTPVDVSCVPFTFTLGFNATNVQLQIGANNGVNYATYTFTLTGLTAPYDCDSFSLPYDPSSSAFSFPSLCNGSFTDSPTNVTVVGI